MIKANITKEQAILMLKWSTDVGADEALNEQTGYRFKDKVLNNKAITEIDVQDPLLLDIESESINKVLIKSNIQVGDEGLSATNLANQCHSVRDIISGIKTFPSFKLYDNKGDVDFYVGNTEASVLIFKEPEIYSSHKDNEITSDAKKLLFNRIFESIDRVLSDISAESCGSIVTFPNYFDSSEQAKDYNFDLIRPFLIRYVKLIKPRAIILMDGFLVDRLFDKDNLNKDNDFMKGIIIATFPSLDVLLRAPKRKRDVWDTILDLKKNLRKVE